MSSLIRIAAAQIDVKLAELEANTEKICKWINDSAGQGVKLTIFPECATSGYCYESREEAYAQAVPIDGPLTEQIIQTCHQQSHFAIFGLLERDGDQLYNALALVGPDGLLGSYRKVHLPKLGVDNFVDRGNRPFEVHDLGWLRIGMQICYDGSFPEPTRVMALGGADLVVLPTNWPPGAGYTADYVPNCRALENHVYFAACNRVGEERGFEFVGKSKICEPNGGNLAFEDSRNESLLVADIDPEIARVKRLVRVPNKHEIDRFADRQPAHYGPLAADQSPLASDQTR